MGTKRIKKADRDGTRFLALPHVVLDSKAYLNLSAPATRLLLDMARQLSAQNNGRLVACSKYLKTRGWNSHDTATRARRELEQAGLIFRTRKGARPNKAAWFAVTWTGLHWSPEMDIAERSFPRGQYMRDNSLHSVKKSHLNPPRGLVNDLIVP